MTTIEKERIGRNERTHEAGVVAFAFGSSQRTLANQNIAARAFNASTRLAVPLMAQRDVPLRGKVEYVPEGDSSKPLPTLRIARWAVQRAIQRGMKTLYVVGAPQHRRRALRDLRFAVCETDAEIEVKLWGLPPEGVKWFSWNSSQLRTRSRLFWWPRELVLRALPMPIYKRIAG